MWRKDGVEIDATKDDRVKMDKNKDGTYFLQVNKSAVEDSGKYTVAVSNKNGQGGYVEENVEVTVKAAPSVVQEDVNADAAVKVDQPPHEEQTEAVEAVVKLPQFSQPPEAVSVVEGETILIVFKLVQGTWMLRSA